MSTKLEPGPFDGLQRAELDEPVFTLRAHDPLAAPLVHLWVERRRAAIRAALNAEPPTITEEKAAVELLQCREAEDIALEMEAWRKRDPEPESEAGAPERPASTYSGITKTSEELQAKARHEAIKAACSKLNNAVSEITDAANDALQPHGFHHERAVILTMASRLAFVSGHIAPKRASFYVGQPMPEPFDLKAALVCINDVRGNMDGADGR
jgi:hypothetical protein